MVVPHPGARRSGGGIVAFSRTCKLAAGQEIMTQISLGAVVFLAYESLARPIVGAIERWKAALRGVACQVVGLIGGSSFFAVDGVSSVKS